MAASALFLAAESPVKAQTIGGTVIRSVGAVERATSCSVNKLSGGNSTPNTLLNAKRDSHFIPVC